jgi:hypothetical protein
VITAKVRSHWLLFGFFQGFQTPAIPKGFPARDHDLILRLFLSSLSLWPFKDGIGRHDAAPLPERVLPELGPLNAF